MKSPMRRYCLALLALLAANVFEYRSVAGDTEAPANTEEPVRASLYYANVEPRQLFQMLSETFHVQFEGVEQVEGPLTLISHEQEMVDLEGMLALLNTVLSEQNRGAIRQGQIIRIVPVQNIERAWVQLEHANLDAVATFLRELYIDDPEAVGDRRMRVIRKHPELPRIFLVGPRELIAEVQELVTTELDVAPPRPAAPEPTPTPTPAPEPPRPPTKVRYISLEYIDATEFQALLQNDEILRGRFNSAAAPNNTVAVSSREDEVFERIDEMRAAFDVDRMEIRYYPLRNAQAQTMANLLQQIYPPETEALPEELSRARRAALAQAGLMSLTPTEARDLDEVLAQELQLMRAGPLDRRTQALLSGAITIVGAGELTIIPDTERNGLLIRTFSRNFPKVLELVQQLDQPRSQVMIDVFITEVRLDDGLQLGMDFTYTGTSQRQDGTYTLRQNVGAQVSNLGVSYQLISDNITAYLRALQETGKLDVITRPQIITKDNTAAFISLGRQVPLVEKTTVSTEGAVSSSVAYRDVVTRLEVTPQIHPDGYVSMVIKQTMDDVGTETFQISERFNPQVIIKREAQTQVRVRDGQTICIGGFISDKITENDSGIPFLKDIPILGRAFSYLDRQRVETELIIFITPHILRTPTEMLRMTNAQRDLVDVDGTDQRGADILPRQQTLVRPRYADPEGPAVEQPVTPVEPESARPNPGSEDRERPAPPTAEESSPETTP